MRGLLLKELYLLRRYGKTQLLFAAVFLGAYLLYEDSPFFLLYPFVVCGVLPMSLLGHDEQDRWLRYSAALPCTRGQTVSCKYVVVLGLLGATLALVGLGLGVKAALFGGVGSETLASALGMGLGVGALTPALSLPFLFRWGVQKGAVAYYFVVGAAFGAALVVSRLPGIDWRGAFPVRAALPVLVLVMAGVFGLSWALSVRFYRAREL